jgi:hypothetical protein
LLLAACLVLGVLASVAAVLCLSLRADGLERCHEQIEVGITLNEARALLEGRHRLTHVDSAGNATEVVWIYQDVVGTSALLVTVSNDGIVTGTEIDRQFGRNNSSLRRVATFIGLP